MLVSLLLLFGCAEGLLRLLGAGAVAGPRPAMRFSPTPWMRADEEMGVALVPGRFDVTLGTSPELRRWRVTHQDDGSRRVVGGRGSEGSLVVSLHGDSFVYGFGVDDEQTVASGLASRLPGFEVRNRAVPGFGLPQVWLAVEHELAGGPVDLVLVGYGAHLDERTVLACNWRRSLAGFQEGHGLGPVRFPRSLSRRGPVKISMAPMSWRPWPLAEGSALVAMTERVWCARDGARRRDWEVSRHLLVELARRVERAGTGLLVLGLDRSGATRATLDALERAGVPVADVGVDLTSSAWSLLPVDSHPNAEAHAHWAERVAVPVLDALGRRVVHDATDDATIETIEPALHGY